MATTKATKSATKKTAAKKVAAKKPSAASKLKTPATHHDIAILAEQLWIERGRPHGSSHVDWLHAEQKLNG